MSLDPDTERVLEMIRASGRPPIQSLPPREAREAYRASRKALMPDPPDVAQVRDLAAPAPGGEIPLRSYRGLGTSGKLPVLIFFHGGGFCIGDRDTHDYICRKIANSAGCAVVSVDYRLAPEHKFPAAVDDGSAAVAWLGEQGQMLGIDAGRIAVGGDSGGGNLAAVMAHMARDGDLPPLDAHVDLQWPDAPAPAVFRAIVAAFAGDDPADDDAPLRAGASVLSAAARSGNPSCNAS